MSEWAIVHRKSVKQYGQDSAKNTQTKNKG